MKKNYQLAHKIDWFTVIKTMAVALIVAALAAMAADGYAPPGR